MRRAAARPQIRPPFRPSSHNPDGDSIELRAKEVKKESLMEHIESIGVSDFWSKVGSDAT